MIYSSPSLSESPPSPLSSSILRNCSIAAARSSSVSTSLLIVAISLLIVATSLLIAAVDATPFSVYRISDPVPVKADTVVLSDISTVLMYLAGGDKIVALVTLGWIKRGGSGGVMMIMRRCVKLTRESTNKNCFPRAQPLENGW